MRNVKYALIVAIVAAFSIFADPSFAQVPTDFSGLIKGPTTLTNAALDTTFVTIAGPKSDIAFKYDISKTSGTVAGTIVVKARASNAATEQWITLNSYTLTDATATSDYRLANNPYVYYIIITTTTGTQVSVHRKFITYRK